MRVEGSSARAVCLVISIRAARIPPPPLPPPHLDFYSFATHDRLLRITKKRQKILWRASRALLSRTRQPVKLVTPSSSQRRCYLAVTSFYILFYEDRCVARSATPGLVFAWTEGGYTGGCGLGRAFFTTVRLPPFRRPRRRSIKPADPPRIPRSSPSYPLALKAARHLIAVIFHRALAAVGERGHKIQSHPRPSISDPTTRRP